MKVVLLVLISGISLTASAQWWQFKKTVPRPEPLAPAQTHQPDKFMVDAVISHPRIPNITLARSDYSLEASEASVMKTAQHNMRFRIYDMASYNFSELAQLYAQQNRFSEAKWYFLQSSFLSRRQNNHKLTISNLTRLAKVKMEIGDILLARQDLLEARDIAASCGWLMEVIGAEKKLDEMQHRRIASLKNEKRYAELAGVN